MTMREVSDEVLQQASGMFVSVASTGGQQSSINVHKSGTALFQRCICKKKKKKRKLSHKNKQA